MPPLLALARQAFRIASTCARNSGSAFQVLIVRGLHPTASAIAGTVFLSATNLAAWWRFASLESMG